MLRREKVRRPGFEPGSFPWEGNILTTVLSAQTAALPEVCGYRVSSRASAAYALALTRRLIRPIRQTVMSKMRQHGRKHGGSQRSLNNMC